MAKLLGICTATYNRYEKGILKPDAFKLIQIADVYGVSVDYLLMRTDNPHLFSMKESHHLIAQQEYIDFITKYAAVDERSRAAISALLNYEYQQTKNTRKKN